MPFLSQVFSSAFVGMGLSVVILDTAYRVRVLHFLILTRVISTIFVTGDIQNYGPFLNGALV